MNWLTTSASPPTSSSERFVRPVVILEDPQLADPARERVGRRLVIAVTDAEQHEQSAADRADRPAVDPDLGAGDPLQERAHAAASRRPGASVGDRAAFAIARIRSTSAAMSSAR